ncbi:MAG: hypothetical protein ACYC27_02985 [Armatimonadota bacterium]
MKKVKDKCEWCGCRLSSVARSVNRYALDCRNICTVCRDNMRKLSAEQIKDRDKASLKACAKVR